MEGEQEQGRGSIISLEFIVGLIAIALGAYNLLSMFGVITYDITLPQATANTILIIAGLFLWLTAYRLWRHKYYSRRIFH
jgi:hypothetical protein